jgi:hypothetical protein
VSGVKEQGLFLIYRQGNQKKVQNQNNKGIGLGCMSHEQ